MVPYFSDELLSQPGVRGGLARGSTYLAAVVLFLVGVAMALLTIAWLVTGPIAEASYSHAPRCVAAITDSCRGFITGQITHASISGGRTNFDVIAGGHLYKNYVTENAAPDLKIGEVVQVEVWQGSVVAITLSGGQRVITASDPEWQAGNYGVPIFGVIMFPVLSFFAFRQLRGALQGTRALRSVRGSGVS